jgi:hypothetical protein
MKEKFIISPYSVIIKVSFIVLLLTGCETGNLPGIVDAASNEAVVNIDTLNSRLKHGILSRQQYDSLMAVYEARKSADAAALENVQPASGLPRWARDLGLPDPVGLHLDCARSQSTSDKYPDQGFNSVILVYTGDYGLVCTEAERLAKAANIPPRMVSRQKPVQKGGDNFPVEHEILYTNYDLKTRMTGHLISIEAEYPGKLTVMATDMVQLNNKLSGAYPSGKNLK